MNKEALLHYQLNDFVMIYIDLLEQPKNRKIALIKYLDDYENRIMVRLSRQTRLSRLS